MVAIYCRIYSGTLRRPYCGRREAVVQVRAGCIRLHRDKECNFWSRGPETADRSTQFQRTPRRFHTFSRPHLPFGFPGFINSLLGIGSCRLRDDLIRFFPGVSLISSFRSESFIKDLAPSTSLRIVRDVYEWARFAIRFSSRSLPLPRPFTVSRIRFPVWRTKPDSSAAETNLRGTMDGTSLSAAVTIQYRIAESVLHFFRASAFPFICQYQITGFPQLFVFFRGSQPLRRRYRASLTKDDLRSWPTFSSPQP